MKTKDIICTRGDGKANRRAGGETYHRAIILNYSKGLGPTIEYGDMSFTRERTSCY